MNTATSEQGLNQKSRRRLADQILQSGLLVYGMLALLLICAQIAMPGFMQIKNVANILKMASFTGIAAIGQTLVILIGGIDMSISNVVTFSNIVAAQMMMGQNENIFVTLVVVLLIGAAIGFLNATGINYLKIPPMIMTLGIGTVVQGIALLYSKGAPKGNAAPLIRSMVNDAAIGGVLSGVVVFWAVAALLMIVTLRYTTFGRKIYATGTSALASKFAGIDSQKIIYFCYILSGITAAVTGILLAGYTGTASAESGEMYSMNSIVAVVIGATAITGGKGGYGGTIAGAIIMAVLDSILTVVNIPKSGRMMAQGAIVLLMVLIYGRSKKQYS